MSPKILHVVGARPNFMKIAPVMAALERSPGSFRQLLVHTGQHYDQNMSGVFFDELSLPPPDRYLDVGSATHAIQTARIMMAFEPVLCEERPDWVVVAGDVNSTLACTLVAAKLGIRVAHVEAGLRSFDRTMPEEVNRVVTDQVADLLFTPSRDADENLKREGIAAERVRFVGNVMIDTLLRLLPRARQREAAVGQSLEPGQFVLATLHRPSNVDRRGPLLEICRGLAEVSKERPVLFAVHPRTRKRLSELGGLPELRGGDIRLVEPLGYLDFLSLVQSAACVVSDSGGIQEETTYLGVPCVTVRPNTERPITITEGTNRLAPSTRAAIIQAVGAALDAPRRTPQIEFWDGKAAERIAAALSELA